MWWRRRLTDREYVERVRRHMPRLLSVKPSLIMIVGGTFVVGLAVYASIDLEWRERAYFERIAGASDLSTDEVAELVDETQFWLGISPCRCVHLDGARCG